MAGTEADAQRFDGMSVLRWFAMRWRAMASISSESYARNPVNLLLLLVVPTVFVVVVAGSVADWAELLGGLGGPAVETATAGWAAAFLAGIAMYFQTASTRDTDRRVVIAGLPAKRLVAARLITGTVLAVLASAAALLALAVRTGIDDPGRPSPLRMLWITAALGVSFVGIQWGLRDPALLRFAALRALLGGAALAIVARWQR